MLAASSSCGETTKGVVAAHDSGRLAVVAQVQIVKVTHIVHISDIPPPLLRVR